MNQPKKILLVVMDFWQAGAQRFAYELDSALNKTEFEISILSLRNLNANDHFSDYYYTKHIALGSKIYFLKNLVDANHASQKRFNTSLFKKRNYQKTDVEKNKEEKINFFLKQFDIINWIGEYAFSPLGKYLASSVYDKSIIHIMSFKFQGLHVYHLFPKDKRYLFASGFNSESQVQYELSEFSNYQYVLFPLCLKINPEKNQWQFSNKKKRIGIFTRLDKGKPLDPFMYAFHLLLDKYPDLELHIFGTGDPEVVGVKRYTTHLGIESNVFFRGHVADISETAIREKLDLVWYQGYINQPGGYAGLDICLTGIPQIFWEFTESKGNVIDEATIYPVYKNLNLFVKRSRELLTNAEKAAALSNRQFNDVYENRNAEKNITILENLFVEVLENGIRENDKQILN